MRVFVAVLVLSLGSLAVPAALWGKCTSDLPEEIFQFFGEKKGKVVCDDYEYKFADLDGEKPMEFLVVNYRACERLGYCTTEAFQQKGKTVVHIASVPGRAKVMETKTNGFHDLSTSVLGSKFVYVWDGATYRDMMTVKSSTEKKPENLSPPTTPTPATPQ
jgi:hypothetical protein